MIRCLLILVFFSILAHSATGMRSLGCFSFMSLSHDDENDEDDEDDDEDDDDDDQDDEEDKMVARTVIMVMIVIENSDKCD